MTESNITENEFMKKIAPLFFLLILSFSINAQEIQLPKLLEMAERSTRKYVESFKNLIAEETKTIETFKKDQSLEEKRVIKSNFIVYQLQTGVRVSEFRTVYEFNGKKISQSDKQIVKFFEKLAKSSDADEEFAKLRKESVRFDGSFIVWGMTLRKDFLLQPQIRAIFDYKILGTEKFNDRNVYVVEYRQKEYSPYVLVNPTKLEINKTKIGFQFNTILSEKLLPSNPRLNGVMWLDAETGEMWKNKYEVSIQPAILDKPIVTNESSYEYQPSRFGIAVPKDITITSYRTFGAPGKDLSVSKFATTVLSYSNFSELNSEAKDYKADDDKN
jgi:hypothetical protein